MSELPPKDKRTRAYKEWAKKHAQSSEGLGDSIAKVTKATGIKKAVKWLAGEDCGCDERQKKMNELWRYKKPECLTKEEFILIKMAVETKKQKFTPVEQETYKKIYERVFKTKVQCTPCSFGKQIWKELVAIYNYYL